MCCYYKITLLKCLTIARGKPGSSLIITSITYRHIRILEWINGILATTYCNVNMIYSR